MVSFAAPPARARTLKQQGFASSACRFSLFSLFRARPRKLEAELKQYRQQVQNAPNRAHVCNPKQFPTLIQNGAKQAPQIDPGSLRRPQSRQKHARKAPRTRQKRAKSARKRFLQLRRFGVPSLKTSGIHIPEPKIDAPASAGCGFPDSSKNGLP